MAEGDSPAVDPATKRLEMAKLEAELRKLQAEALQAERTALIPKLPESVPAEKLDVGDKGSGIAELAAYAGIDDLAEAVVLAIAQDLGRRDGAGDSTRNLAGATVWIVPPGVTTSNNALYNTVMSQLETLQGHANLVRRLVAPARTGERGLDKLGGATMMAAAPMLAQTVASVAPLVLSAFRTNTTIRGRDFTVAASAVRAGVARQLLERRASVHLDGLTPIPDNDVTAKVKRLADARNILLARKTQWSTRLAGTLQTDLATKTTRLGALTKRRDDSDDEVERKRLGDEIAELTPEVHAAQSEVDEAQCRVDLAQNTASAIDAFLTFIHTAGEGAPAPISVAALQHEMFHGGGGNTYLATVESVFSGGESQYEEKWGEDRSYHLSGLAVSWAVVDTSGVVKSSGVKAGLGSVSGRVGHPPVVNKPQILP